MSDALFPEGAVLVVGGSGGIGRSSVSSSRKPARTSH